MVWWHPLVALIDAYLLLALGPWIALQIMDAGRRQDERMLDHEAEHLERLRRAMAEQQAARPAQARSGPYRAMDEAASKGMVELAAQLDQFADALGTAHAFVPGRLGLRQVLALGAWRRLRETRTAVRALRRLGELSESADYTLFSLQNQQQAIRSIPDRARGLLQEQLAEIRRLSAVYESEQEDYGTRGLGATGRTLEELRQSIESAVAALDQAPEDALPRAVEACEQVGASVQPQIEALDARVRGLANARTRAWNALHKSISSLELTQERWQGLQNLGAREPAIGNKLDELAEQLETLRARATARTLDSYTVVALGSDALQDALKEAAESVDALAGLQQRSEASIEGDVQIVARVQQACDELKEAFPQALLDDSLGLMERAASSFIDAERQHATGTRDGYGRAIQLAQNATDLLMEAEAAHGEFATTIHQVLDLVETVNMEAISEAEQRLGAAREGLTAFPWHWEQEGSDACTRAAAHVAAASQHLAALPERLVQDGVLAQSEAKAVVGTLAAGNESLDAAHAAIDALEAQLTHITECRSLVEESIDRLRAERWPELQEAAPTMLPELAERLKAAHAEFRRGVDTRSRPDTTDYVEAAETWLPSVAASIAEIDKAHRDDVGHYRRLLRDTSRRLDRAWSRLERLDPETLPRPDEDTRVLADDLEDWRTATERERANPRVLSGLLGRSAQSLEQRIESARRQLLDGQKELASLERSYERHAETVHGMRQDSRKLRRGSQWSAIVWDTAQADALWEGASDRRQAADAAPTLTDVANGLQRAIHDAEDAERAYSTALDGIESALERLDTELSDINETMAYVQRLSAQATEQGDTERGEELLDLCTQAGELMAAARVATTFEGALRRLRDAKNVLARV